ncbi:enoyl-CoA hydratase/isomerase family protein [Xylophilus sp. GOD-11R]|uniref:enoyl-CoA hydratase/isomerase family protein n=1 Tax=Xylophilus sp. GOD-11R TaxID=3089814 RepID=UPI00298D0B41|nr:enoyl-CoA hydratase/isomerase family protein [Xylophilus sp. GOD-11R]WPB55550.1 enoyl-CoA hydratase/isomerase family protein [Xylophilus sp. GOD-11R]
MPTPSPIRIHIDGVRATVTLDRPAVRNAFNDETIAALTAAFRDLGANERLRCIVLAANGPAFCAGADLNWMQRMAGYSFDENVADAQALADMLRTLYECPVPTIARIQGDVFAGGVGLVAACDMAVAVDSARFCLSEVLIGLIPATIGPYVLRALGARTSHRYFLTGERFGAAEAHRAGLVHEAVPAEALDATVDTLANALANAGPQAVRAAKAFVRDVAGRPVDDALARQTAHEIARLRTSDEGRAGLAAFLSKSTPAWRAEATTGAAA